jgi:titin
MDVSELTKTSAKLSWKPPSNDGGSPLTGYIIEKKEGRRTTWARCDKHAVSMTTQNTLPLYKCLESTTQNTYQIYSLE